MNLLSDQVIGDLIMLKLVAISARRNSPKMEAMDELRFTYFPYFRWNKLIF